MSWLGKVLQEVRGCLAARAAAPASRLHVANLTRNTVLATTMELADTAPKRNKGLLGRLDFPAGEGLWIVPCEAVHTVGMKFSIDLVYLDRQNGIKKLRSAVAPWRLSGCLFAHSVMELPAGTIRATQTQLGDRLEFSSVPLPLNQTERA